MGSNKNPAKMSGTFDEERNSFSICSSVREIALQNLTFGVSAGFGTRAPPLELQAPERGCRAVQRGRSPVSMMRSKLPLLLMIRYLKVLNLFPKKERSISEYLRYLKRKIFRNRFAFSQ